MQFIYFLGRSFASAIWRALIMAVLLALGVTPKFVWGIVTEPPWYLTHPSVQAACIVIAFLIMAWIFYDQSRVEAQIPPRLKRRAVLTFAEIADGLADVPAFGYSKEEIMHRLMKAVWLRDFERRSGKSSVSIEAGDGVRLIGDEWIPISGSTNPAGERVHVDADGTPERLHFNRETLLSVLVDDLRQIYPGLVELLRRPDAEVRSRLNVPILLRIRPHHISEHHRSAYLDRLLIPRGDFVHWFKRLLAGRYDKNPEWSP